MSSLSKPLLIVGTTMNKSKLHRDGHYIDVTLFEVQGIRARVSSSKHTVYVLYIIMILWFCWSKMNE